MLFQMKWTECLQGTGSLRECLGDLSDIFGAEVVHLHRACEETGRQRTIASVDRDARRGARPLTRAIGPAILASARSRARPGTVWLLEDDEKLTASHREERAFRWLSDRGIREVAAIPLDRDGMETDILELYMPVPLRAQSRTHLECLASAAATAWSRRQKGRISRVLSAMPAVTERLAQELTPRGATLLSPSNPANLTAAEMRICAMFSAGHSTTDLTRALQISDSTLRTHLRNIYAKTGVSGQVELVRVLLSAQNPGDGIRDAG